MPFKVACPAGHKLVLAGATAERPLVCPKCGLPIPPDSANAEQSSRFSPADACIEPSESDKPVETCVNDASLPPPMAPPSPPPRLPVIQVRPRPGGSVRWKPGRGALGGVLVAAALASAAPAIGEFIVTFGTNAPGSSTDPARWALVLTWLALVQAAYGAFCWLWSDWSGWRVVTLALVLQAGIHAALLAIILLANPQGWILGERGLQLSGALTGGRAALGCLSLICLCAILGLFAARESVRWRRMDARARH